MNLIEANIGVRRDSVKEQMVVDALKAMPETERLKIIIEYIRFSKSLVDYNRAKMVLKIASRVLNNFSSFEELLNVSLAESDRSTIQFWIKYISPRIGLRKVVSFYKKTVLTGSKNEASVVGWALYWMKPTHLPGQWFVGANEKVSELREVFLKRDEK